MDGALAHALDSFSTVPWQARGFFAPKTLNVVGTIGEAIAYYNEGPGIPAQGETVPATQICILTRSPAVLNCVIPNVLSNWWR
jgi:hypothetical protein